MAKLAQSHIAELQECVVFEASLFSGTQGSVLNILVTLFIIVTTDWCSGNADHTLTHLTAVALAN